MKIPRTESQAPNKLKIKSEKIKRPLLELGS
jgi:hypothetical protein